MPASDVAFTFDPMPVLNGVKRIDQGMGNLSRSFSKSAKGMSNAVAAGMVKATAFVGTLVGAVMGLRNIFRRMPEFGQVFKIAGDIFFRNFLFPIRKELMPLLQQLLDWVRDNRALFVRWGAVVARVIRGVVKAVRFLIDLLQTIGKKLLQWMGMDSLAEFINILSFKIATIAIGIKILAQSVGTFIKGIWDRAGGEATRLITNLWDTLVMVGEDILVWVAKFTKGFAETFDLGGTIETVVKVYGDLVEIFRNLWNALFGGERGAKWGKFFEGLGRLTGASFTLLAASLRELYDIIADFINDVIETPAFQKLMDFLANLAEIAGGAMAKGAEFLAELTERFTGGREEREARREATNVFEDPRVVKLFGGVPGGTSPAPGATTNNEVRIIVEGAGDPQAVGDAVVDAWQRRVNTEAQAGAR